MKDKKYKKINLTKLPAVATVVIVILFIYKNSGSIVDKLKNAKQSSQTNENTSTTVDIKEPTLDLTQWKEFNNTDYRFTLRIPPLLLSRQLENQTDYLLFVKFEENRYSKDKGVALGVTKRTRDEEVTKVKGEISEIAKIEPKVNKIKVNNLDAVRLDYGQAEGFEEKSIVVVSNEKFTVSVSTTPNQIENIISSFKYY